MTDVLSDIFQTFGNVKRAGAAGEKLASDLDKMIGYMDSVIGTFELAQTDAEWQMNMDLFLTDESRTWAYEVCLELKQTRAKLTELHL